MVSRVLLVREHNTRETAGKKSPRPVRYGRRRAVCCARGTPRTCRRRPLRANRPRSHDPQSTWPRKRRRSHDRGISTTRQLHKQVTCYGVERNASARETHGRCTTVRPIAPRRERLRYYTYGRACVCVCVRRGRLQSRCTVSARRCSGSKCCTPATACTRLPPDSGAASAAAATLKPVRRRRRRREMTSRVWPSKTASGIGRDERAGTYARKPYA